MTYFVVLAVSLLCSAVGFHMYIYFFSLGYGLAVAGLGVTYWILFRQSMGAAELTLCALLVIYGLRLAGYLLARELRSAAYRNVLSPELKRSAQMPLGAKYGLWLVCGILYVLQTCPVFFRLLNGEPAGPSVWVGVAIMVCGLVLETAADLQKTIAKRKHPRQFVSSGLYALVRCPNYLGELIFWTGVLVSGFTALHGALQWTLALVGYLLIIWIMFSGARRLEIRQDRNYGSDPAYQKYVTSVPILLPLVPLYSVRRYKFFIA